ncbi:hypothetical protein CAURIC_04540 [Corynebacterium auriscanis]|nr:hypothetical protein CAURIC_04540 [Corynebacterium auriscanis]
MKLHKALTTTLIMPLLTLGACSSSDEATTTTPATTSNAPSASTALSTTTQPLKPAPSPTAPRPVPTEASSETPAAAPTQEPYVIECLPGTPGPSRMSDGTIRATDFCVNQPGADTYMESERGAGLDPSEVPYTNGGTCPAYKCGYGTAPDGTPNKGSGQLQFEYGCRHGYIDSQQCAAAGY